MHLDSTVAHTDTVRLHFNTNRNRNKILVSVYFSCSLHMHIYGVNFVFSFHSLFRTYCALSRTKKTKMPTLQTWFSAHLLNVFIYTHKIFIWRLFMCSLFSCFYYYFHCIYGWNQFFMFNVDLDHRENKLFVVLLCHLQPCSRHADTHAQAHCPLYYCHTNKLKLIFESLLKTKRSNGCGGVAN